MSVTLDPVTDLDMDLLRVSTAGSVDDGKSTLIGRLLLDTKQIMIDQLAQVEDASRRQGFDRTELALVTDGLRAEREQGITIDVAYRYFHTPRRKFIVADTPGHPQYTRNMVTGASTCDVAVVLVDARNGLTEQSRRHAFLSSLLGIRHLVVAVNKMDLVGWSQQRFAEIRGEFADFAAHLDAVETNFVPISALHGDHVVRGSDQMPWYDGPPLLSHLEQLDLAPERDVTGARLPVQWVIRPQSDAHHDYRGYAGQLVGGTLRPGDEVVVLPSGLTTTVAAIDTYDGPVERALPPMSVTVRLADDLDVSRGDVLASPHDPPTTSQDLDVMVTWMSQRPLTERAVYALEHTTNNVRAMAADVVDRLDVTTLARDPSATELGLNDIGRVRLRATEPIHHDPYRRNRLTGGLTLIDEATNATVGAGTILGR